MDNPIDDQVNLNNNDNPPIGWQILAFLIPIAGIIMYFNNNKEFPNKAKRYILLAGISIAINVMFRLSLR